MKTRIELGSVVSVYSGKPGCCCGCRGKHTYASAHRELGGNRRGYAVDDDEVDDAVVSRHLNTINAAIDRGEAEDGGSHVSYETGNRLYIAYLL